MTTMYDYEQKALAQGYKHIAGCDEVGRGPLAGPLVAAAVVLDPDHPIEGLNDSKQLSEKKRDALAKEIKTSALSYAIIHIEPEEVDRLNVYKASQVAMRRAVRKLGKWDYVLSDAIPIPGLDVPVEPIVKGDAKSASIAAASILAKVSRDAYMVGISKDYPEYGFEAHKGYPTRKHLEALETYGIIAEHRRSYAPVKNILNKQQSLDIGE
ncbi:MAG: ribonuclease HII [Bacillota bacterium]